MPSLKVMTFNVQLMTRLISKGKFDLGEAFSDPYEERITKLVAALKSDALPDVLVLNEVFSEEAKGRLLKKLKGYYPNVVPAFGETDIHALLPLKKLDDSGLMFFSRWPCKFRSFFPYSAAAGYDIVAQKGFGIVEVDTHLSKVYIILTHLQADKAHANIRNKQLTTIKTKIPQLNDAYPIIMCGDLNIIGNKLGNPPSRPEWEDIFKQSLKSGSLYDLFTDCWDTHMPTEDNGQTNETQRLDYILLHDGEAVEPIVAQHMRVRHRGVSDHFAVWADLNFKSENCTPATARPVVVNSLCGGENLSFKYPGSMQWCRFDVPGTYVFTKPSNHMLKIYEATNISDPIPDFDRTLVDLQNIPDSENAYQEMNLPPVGRKFYIPNAPFFVQLTNKADISQNTSLGWVKCEGRSPFDAIILGSHHEETYRWDSSAAVDQLAWFEAIINRSIDGQPHTSTFYVDNPLGLHIKLRVIKWDMNVNTHPVILAESKWEDKRRVKVKFTDVGPCRVFFTVERKDTATQVITAFWRTQLTLLMGVRDSDEQTTHKLVLYCQDETGVDWWGGDETQLRLFDAGTQIAKFPADRDHWSADSGDKKYFPFAPIFFLNNIDFEVRELDITGDDVGRGQIEPLLDPKNAGDDPNLHEANHKPSVKVGSGTYQLWYNLGRNPVGGSLNGLP